MHVLGLPPAFVLSQDQTLRLKVRTWFLAWRLIQGYCVTGTFTLDLRPGLPRTSYHGDGLETQYRQSLVSFAHSENGTETRQDSAACVSLPSINLSKSAIATTSKARRATLVDHRQQYETTTGISLRASSRFERSRCQERQTHVASALTGARSRHPSSMCQT